MSNLFAFPVVGRAGLGNMLLPWARAEIFARRAGARMIRPFWNTVRLGPHLRREPLKRDYLGFFGRIDHIDGIARLWRLARGARLAEDELATPSADGRPRVVCFRGLGAYFAPLAGEHAFIRDRLWRMTRPELRPPPLAGGGRFIGMHIRRGDVTRQGLTPEHLARWELFTPTAWFLGMAYAIRRRAVLADLPIVIFTDGSRAEIADLLRIDNVHLHRAGTAITDLWALSQASLLIASGFSTYSQWASYLGGMPTIYAPGKMQQEVQIGRPEALEVELSAHDDLPRALYDQLAYRHAAEAAVPLAS